MKLQPKGKFILIDDDKEDHEIFRMALSRICDNEVLSAYDGEEGFNLLKENKDKVFLVICDLQMPRLNGLELKRLIEDTPEIKMQAIPFIYHSSITDPLIVKEAYALNIQGYMQKSADISKTISVLEYFIRFWSATMHPNFFTPANLDI